MESEILKVILKEGIWAALFVSLLFYVLKTNERRESRMLDCLETLGRQYEFLANDVTKVRDDVNEVRDDVKDLKGMLR